NSSTMLYLIYVGTIMDDKCPVSVQWLKEITEGILIDLVVMSCAYPDLCDRRLEKKNEQFDNKLPLFQSKLSHICSMFKLAFPDSIMIWVPPLPQKLLNDKQTNQLKKLIQICYDVACDEYNFDFLKRYQNWIDCYKQFYVKDAFYISKNGVRELTTELGELMKKKWSHYIQMNPPNKRFKTDNDLLKI
ncbi:unnamed protein product, partial [Rotaria sp. Silwood2]